MQKQRLMMFAACCAFLLSACGGGSETSSNSPTTVAPQANAPTTVSGTVTGFGQSLVVDGLSYEDGQATVTVDVDPRAETAGTMTDVKIGQQVEASVDNAGKVTKIVVRATVIGPVQSVDVAGKSFKVLGQTIKVIDAGEGKTLFSGVADLAGLKMNDWVEVHGTIDADKNVVATRVELKPAGAALQLRAGGIVKELNAAAKTFKLGELVIDYANADVKPNAASLANDSFVFVYSDQLPAAGKLSAKAVRVLTPPTLDGRKFTIGGLVTDASADGKSFRVNGLKIDASTAEIKGGQGATLADIKNLALVRVEGTLAVTAGTPTLKASRVFVIPASEQRRILLLGQVTDYVSAASFKVQGVPVNADAAEFKNGVKADLKNGAFVLVKGRIDGTLIKADEVNFQTPPKDVDFKLFGLVTEYNAVAKTFKLLGIPMQLTNGVKFAGGVAADFKNGAAVEVKGAFNGNVFLVSEVEFKTPDAAPTINLEGVISELAATGFKLNGVLIKLNAQTVIEGGPLANGQRVEVQAQLMGAELLARKVEVQAAGTSVLARGPISGFVSAANFKVGGQVVDASAAQFRNGTAANLANGKIVSVRGSLEAGKIKASQVVFLPLIPQ